MSSSQFVKGILAAFVTLHSLSNKEQIPNLIILIVRIHCCVVLIQSWIYGQWSAKGLNIQYLKDMAYLFINFITMWRKCKCWSICFQYTNIERNEPQKSPVEILFY